MIVTKRLPNAIGVSDVADVNVRNKLMLIDENVRSVHSQLEEVQDVCKAGAVGNVSVNSLATKVAPLVETIVMQESTTAAQAAQTATQKAAEAAGFSSSSSESASLAAASADSAADSETNAGTSERNALAYETAAETARDRAEAAAASTVFVTTLGYNNLDLGADTYTKFFMDAIVIDTTESYDVKITFNNTTTNTYTCSATAFDNSGSQVATESTSVTSRSGSGYKSSVSIVTPGTGFFKIDNSSAYVDVIIQIKEHTS